MHEIGRQQHDQVAQSRPFLVLDQSLDILWRHGHPYPPVKITLGVVRKFSVSAETGELVGARRVILETSIGQFLRVADGDALS